MPSERSSERMRVVSGRASLARTPRSASRSPPPAARERGGGELVVGGEAREHIVERVGRELGQRQRPLARSSRRLDARGAAARRGRGGFFERRDAARASSRSGVELRADALELPVDGRGRITTRGTWRAVRRGGRERAPLGGALAACYWLPVECAYVRRCSSWGSPGFAAVGAREWLPAAN
jgi:hypothetical protein